MPIPAIKKATAVSLQTSCASLGSPFVVGRLGRNRRPFGADGSGFDATIGSCIIVGKEANIASNTHEMVKSNIQYPELLAKLSFCKKRVSGVGFQVSGIMP